jgi:choline/glycine/proline betaine transport protein
MAQQARIHINRPVFFTSGAFILALVLFAVLAPARAQRLFGALQDWIFSNASWFYMLAVATILVTMVLVAFSRYGDIKLGPDHSQPDYRDPTWYKWSKPRAMREAACGCAAVVARRGLDWVMIHPP